MKRSEYKEILKGIFTTETNFMNFTVEKYDLWLDSMDTVNLFKLTEQSMLKLFLSGENNTERANTVKEEYLKATSTGWFEFDKE